MSQMNQVVVKQLGNIEIQKVNRPQVLKKNEVRIEVHYCSFNFADFLQIQGKYQEKPPLPFVMGFESSGIIKEIGGGKTQFKGGDGSILKVGDKVVSMQQGAYQEEIIVHQARCMQVPQKYSLADSTASITVYGTAYLALVNRAQVKQGEWVLVTGASGGQGAAAVKIAKALGCKVIAMARGQKKCDFVRTLGADLVQDLSKGTQKERTQEILQLTNKKGVNVVFECVGGQVFDECMKAVKWGARILVVGFAGGNIPKISTNLLLVKNSSLVGVYWGGHILNDFKTFVQSQQELVNLLNQGTVTPMPYDLFRLEDTKSAIQKMGSHQVLGKFVIATKNSENYNSIPENQTPQITPKL